EKARPSAGLFRWASPRERRGHSAHLMARALFAYFLRMRLQRLGQAGAGVGAGGDGDARTLEVLADGLGAAAQALGQETLGDGVEGLAVFRAGEAVAFVGEQHVGDRDVLGGHGVDDLVALVLLHTRVVGALANQQRLA